MTYSARGPGNLGKAYCVRLCSYSRLKKRGLLIALGFHQGFRVLNFCGIHSTLLRDLLQVIQPIYIYIGLLLINSLTNIISFDIFSHGSPYQFRDRLFHAEWYEVDSITARGVVERSNHRFRGSKHSEVVLLTIKIILYQCEYTFWSRHVVVVVVVVAFLS